jgi:hypothetical protein
VRSDRLPDGFRVTRYDATVRIVLPGVVLDGVQALDPVLTRADAERVAEAVWSAETEGRIDRVVLLRDPRSSEASVARFRERVLALLLDAGMEDLPLEVEVAALHAEPRPDASLDRPGVPRA